MRPAVQRLFLARARRWRASCGHHTVLVLGAASEEGFVFGHRGYIAGIPTAPAGPVGQRLRLCLKHRPHEFVSVALAELQEAFQPCRNGSLGRTAARKGDDGVAATRQAILQDIMYWWMLAEGYVQHPAIQADMRAALGRPFAMPVNDEGQKRHWVAIQRSSGAGGAALAAGSDALRLQSRVQLLDESYQGQYMIGSVRFVRDVPINSPSSGVVSASPHPGVSWGGAQSRAGLEMMPLSLEAIHGAEAARKIAPVDADAPSRMSRQGAARAYHSYMSWGYFQRRMAQHRSDGASVDSPAAAFSSRSSIGGSSSIGNSSRGVRQSAEITAAPDERQGSASSSGGQGAAEAELDLGKSAAAGIDGVAGGSGRWGSGVAAPPDQAVDSQRSYAGDSCRVWRYFESVPEDMASMRTHEAAAVADRHLRALFGSDEECITSLAAWQQMVTEARWVGRALYDAEDIALQYTGGA